MLGYQTGSAVSHQMTKLRRNSMDGAAGRRVLEQIDREILNLG